MKTKNKIFFINQIKSYVHSFYDLTIYGPSEFQFSDSIRYIGTNSIQNIEKLNLGQFISHSNLSFSDYSGSFVDVSNIRYFEKHFKGYFDEELMIIEYGQYSSETLLISTKILLEPEIQSILKGLEDYSIIDEELWSHLEHEAQNEAIVDHIYDDFCRYLENDRHIDLEYFSDDLLLDFFLNCWSMGSFEVENENGLNFYSTHETYFNKLNSLEIIEEVEKFAQGKTNEKH